MSHKKLFLLVSLINGVQLIDNGLVLTPPMGWMSWGYYMCKVECKNTNDCLNEQLILSVVDEFYNSGYQEAGYEYIIIDDCWSEKKRDGNGKLVPDHKRFPNGMKYIADYIHAHGLKFGLYTNAGYFTCMGYPGSRNHLQQDAETFAEWEVDYVKFDGCFVEESFLNQVYITFGQYLNKTGRPMVYSCSWPYYIEFVYKHAPDYKEVMAHCNLWRSYHDISPTWLSVKQTIKYYEKNLNALAMYIGPGAWNDPDMLILGSRSLKEGHSRIQLTVWTMISAPLILGCNLKEIKPYEKSLLQNLDLIAINQDPLGIQAKSHKLRGISVILWVKEHLPMKSNKYLSFSFAFINMSVNNNTVHITPIDYGPSCSDGYSVMDVFTGKFIKNVSVEDVLTVHVAPEDVVLYSLFPLKHKLI